VRFIFFRFAASGSSEYDTEIYNDFLHGGSILLMCKNTNKIRIFALSKQNYGFFMIELSDEQIKERFAAPIFKDISAAAR
jgi:hypothetical protein